jgi:hypothetical protein
MPFADRTLEWILTFGAVFFAALALASSFRIHALNRALRGDALRYDALEAGFAAERLKASLTVRRVAVLLCALSVVGIVLQRW